MPSKRCLVKSCKHPAKRIFKIPNSDVVGNNVWTLWMNVVDPDRRNIGGPYGICSSHFSGIYYLFLIFLNIYYLVLALGVIFTILVSFSQDNALFVLKAKINVFL